MIEHLATASPTASPTAQSTILISTVCVCGCCLIMIIVALLYKTRHWQHKARDAKQHHDNNAAKVSVQSLGDLDPKLPHKNVEGNHMEMIAMAQ